MPLEQEARTFLRELPSLLSDPENRGQFVLIHGDTIIGIWPTRAAALEAGYERFGLTSFMVREIAEPREAPYFSRNLECPSNTAWSSTLPTVKESPRTAVRGLGNTPELDAAQLINPSGFILKNMKL